MSLIQCPECGKEISDKSTTCPNCGYPIKSRNKKFDLQSFDWKSFIATHKKIIVIVGVILIGCLIINAAIGQTNSYNQSKQLKDYESKLQTISSGMYLSASDAESLCNLTTKVWYNAIYKEESYETDKYTKKDNGYWVSDFNDALLALYLDKTDDYSALSDEQEKISDQLEELKNPPEQYKDCYDALTETYGAYKSLVDLAIVPTGSYNSFISNKEERVNNFVDAYNKLEPLLPASEDEDSE